MEERRLPNNLINLRFGNWCCITAFLMFTTKCLLYVWLCIFSSPEILLSYARSRKAEMQGSDGQTK